MVNMKRPLLIILSLVLLLSLFATGCEKANYPGTMNVIEPKDVLKVYGEAGHVVLDARSPEAYAKGHLLGAVNLPPEKLSVNEPFEGMLAPKEQVQKVLQEAGIEKDTVIYVYDDRQGVMSGRVWWTLKVYGHDKVFIVNRGASGLVQAGGQVTTDVPERTASNYPIADANANLIATKADVEAAISDPKTILLDVRSQAEYDAGFIPTAILYPHTKNVFQDGNFVSSKGISINYQELGIEKDTPVIIYCRTSYRATQTMALMQEAGFTNLRIYDGAWKEWEGDQGPKVAPEPPAPTTNSDGS